MYYVLTSLRTSHDFSKFLQAISGTVPSLNYVATGQQLKLHTTLTKNG
jgi:hypothetical protein